MCVFMAYASQLWSIRGEDEMLSMWYSMIKMWVSVDMLMMQCDTSVQELKHVTLNDQNVSIGWCVDDAMCYIVQDIKHVTFDAKNVSIGWCVDDAMQYIGTRR